MHPQVEAMRAKEALERADFRRGMALLLMTFCFGFVVGVLTMLHIGVRA